MRAEYRFDYSKAERGKYYKRLLKGASNVVVLDRDVAREFPDSASVNRALRSVLKGKAEAEHRAGNPRGDPRDQARQARAGRRSPIHRAHQGAM